MSQGFSCSGGKRFVTDVLFLHFSLVSIQFDMIAVVHSGGYAVIQVKHRRDINLKLIVFFNLLRAAFFSAIFGISLEALIRLHDDWRTDD